MTGVCPHCGNTVPETIGPSRYGLTEPQQKVLDFISAYVALEDVAPTFEEIARGVGIVRSNAHRYVLALQERGYIRRLPYRERSITLIGGRTP